MNITYWLAGLAVVVFILGILDAIFSEEEPYDEDDNHSKIDFTNTLF